MAPPLFQRVADAFEATPDAVAVDGPAGRYTFGELARWADGAVSELRARRVGRGEPVGLCFDRSPAMLAAILGVIKHGAAVVPLDPHQPAERIRTIVAGAGCRVTFADPAYADRLPANHPILPPPPADATPQPAGDVGLDDLAYIYHTSGSTGAPKGVAVTHRNVLSLVDGLRSLDLGADDRVTHLVNPAFDVATFELWSPWCAGGTVVVVPRQATPDVAAIAELVAEHRVTALFLPTGLFRLMAAQEPTGLAGVRLVVVGGEAVDSLSVTTIQHDSKPDRIVNGYGPTETATFACAYEFPSDWQAHTTPVPIGRPLPGLQGRVFDRELRSVPDGEEGELYVGGDSVARGYHGAPGLTADRFVPDPDARTPGQRLYRTGDLVRRGPDGELVFLGRGDGQVKIRGNRVELAEVDAVLAADPDVSAACAAVWEPAPGDRRIVAALLGTGDLDLERIRDRARTRLPDFMVPAHLEVTDSLPLTANGKVDRAAVAALVRARLPQPSAPGTDGPRARIAAAWAETLQHDVGPDENFFDAGGDSLLLLQLHARLEQRLGQEISLLDLLEFPTVAGLARHLDATPAQEG
jgi:amino acid adenylation domain-containing protein